MGEVNTDKPSIFQTAPEHEVREYAKRLKGCLSGLTAGINGHIAKDLGIYDE